MVDDEQANLDLVVRTLYRDYEVVSALKPDVALEILLQRPVDVILSDQRMPGMTGVEFLKHVEQSGSLAARILVTAYGDMEVLAHAVNEARIAYYVRKPWDPEHLREVVKRFASEAVARRTPGSVEPGTSAPLATFHQDLAQAIGADPPKAVALLCADIDHLAAVNAEKGISIGDRLIKALVEEVNTHLGAFPKGVATVYQGGRILALLLDADTAKARTVAEAVRQGFAQRVRPIGTSAAVSVGIACCPRDAKDAGTLEGLAEQAMLRAKRLGRNRVADCLPTVLVVGQMPALKHASRGLLSRLDLRMVSCAEEEAIAVIHRERPAAVIADLLGSRQLLDELSALMKLEEHRDTHVLLVCVKDANPTFESRAARIPRAQALMGKHRLGARVSEAAAQCLGIKQRLHLRAEAQLPVQLRRDFDGTQLEGRLVNLSESGAKVSLPRPLATGEAVTLSFRLPRAAVELSARVVRCFHTQNVWELGLEFSDAAPKVQMAIKEYVTAKAPAGAPLGVTPVPLEWPRASPRLDAPRHAVKVRLRPRESKTTVYLRLLNISEGGLLAAVEGKFELPVAEGDVAELRLMGKGIAWGAAGQLLRVVGEGEGRRVALRFVELTDAQKAGLQDLVQRLER